MLRILAQPFQHGFCADDFSGARKTRRVIGSFLRLQLELPQHPRKGRAEFAEPLIVRHDYQAWHYVQHTCGSEEAGDCQRPGRME